MGSGLGLTRSTWRTARSSTSRRVAFSLPSTPGVRAPALTGRKPNWASPLPRRLECARAESPPAARLKRTVTVSKTVRVLDPPRSTLGLTALPRRRTYATRVLRVHLSRVGSARVTSGAVNGGGARVKCACRFYSSRPSVTRRDGCSPQICGRLRRLRRIRRQRRRRRRWEGARRDPIRRARSQGPGG